MNITIRRFVCCLAATALLFAQLAVAAFACQGGVERAVPVAQQQAMAGCEGMGSAPTPLCASHCADGAQSFEKPVTTVVAPAVLVGTMHWLLPAPALHARMGSRPLTRAAPAAGPPLSIRNCCLRI